MTSTILPTHPRNGLLALGYRKDGRPIWPILGGAPDDDDAAADQGDDTNDGDDDTDTGDADGDGPDDDADSDDSDGDDGKDWKAEFEKQQRINRKLERRTKRDMDRIRQLEQASGKKPAASGDADQDDKPDPEELRKAARAEVEAELLNDRVRDKIEVKASKRFADATDAVALVLTEHDIDDFLSDGKIDVDAISDALDELLEKKPYLAEAAAQGGDKKRFQGKADGGSKSSKPSRPKSLDEAVQRHFAAK